MNLTSPTIRRPFRIGHEELDAKRAGGGVGPSRDDRARCACRSARPAIPPAELIAPWAVVGIGEARGRYRFCTKLYAVVEAGRF